MEEKGRILNQVNLRMVQMQLENMRADDQGERVRGGCMSLTMLHA